MKLIISTPLETVVRVADVRSVRAEDESGSFGIEPRHASFVTALAISVVSWRTADGSEQHGAVRGGVFTVAGDTISIATREAVAGSDLAQLETDVLTRFHRAADETAQTRVDTERLRAAAIRTIQRFLRPDRSMAGGSST
jgi:F-type H+-transporting ATPase subunit epsilon